MKVLKEITDWDTPNHVYFTNNSRDKIYAYVKASTNQLEVLKVPMKFKTGGRKFREVPNQWGYLRDEDITVVGKSWVVTGSRGDSYTVTEDATGQRTCTCSGFKFRGQCKHATKLQTKA